MRTVGVFVGAATLDLHYLVPEGRARDSKGPAHDFGVYAGGPAANAAVTFAHLGGRARLYAEIGSHPLGRLAAADLTEQGVGLVDLAADSEALPMVSAILSFEGSGDRMVVSSHYADAGVAESLPGPLPETTGVLLVDGFLRDACLEAAARAADRRIPVVLDAGSWKPGLDDLLPLVDTVVCSADFRPPGTGSHDEVLDYLQGLGIGRVAITRGGDSILYRDETAAGEVPVAAGPVVDTLAAGDILHGAFCRYIVDRPFPDALAAAAQVASRSCRSFGTRAWMEG